MAKFKILVVILLGSCFHKATAQSCNTAYLGTKTLYKTPSKAKRDIPSGFKVVFVNHLNRHGARHLTKDVNTSFAWGFLKKADSLQMLTPDGVRLWQTIVKLNKVEHGNVKNISGEGKTELYELGERLYNNYSEAFNKPVKINFAITKEIRTRQSADAYLKGLKSKIKDSIIITDRVDDTNLRFYDLSPAYTKYETEGAWIANLDSLKVQLKLADMEQRIAARWLKPALLQDLKIAQTDKLISDVFGFESIVYSVKDEIGAAGFSFTDVDLSTFFTCDELTALGKIDAAEGYYQKGPGLDNNGIQVKIAAPLLADFIKTTDAFIKAPKYNAELRFAHAETVSPFAAIMDVENASKHAASSLDIDKTWKPGDIIPLSANIDWVLYKNAKGKYLMKFLLNEKPAKINGIKPATGYYFDWQIAKQHYLKKLIALGAFLNGNMNEYLSGLK
ncbi:histidine-type phosphatase [Mucilaginibacter ginkgonis]|uniref:Multiple inositol polyphosphate phosphatase 1 n=1 Tax=Mucilaginibacter ginkgonis TaxID=2682091 RepID=A0A6I4HY72_9SPHI|nr:histidine-type phosphatase [Mucilaginibacter ginkgonis]QQL49625.1 histidine-type phosphatase [Mucilaginibacter ginkgonis]